MNNFEDDCKSSEKLFIFWLKMTKDVKDVALRVYFLLSFNFVSECFLQQTVKYLFDCHFAVVEPRHLKN